MGVVGDADAGVGDGELEVGDVALDVAMEIAAFQLLGCDRFKPKVSVILNLAPDHLDVFGDVEAYYKAKCRVYQAQDENDVFLKNLDDENIVAVTKYFSFVGMRWKWYMWTMSLPDI